MATPVIRGRAAVWGVVTDAGDTFVAGIIQSQNRDITGEEDYIFDNDGFTITEIFFDDRDECSIDILVETGTTPPARGDDITLAGLACIVQKSSLKWQKKQWAMLTVAAKKFANLTEGA